MPESCVVCERDASIQCRGCNRQLYCGEDHRKQHSTAHKPECRPYTVTTDQKYGRYLVTCRDVRQGELLLRESPLMVGPRVDSYPTCLECFTLLYPPISQCSKCMVSPLCHRCIHNARECQFYSSLSADQKSILVGATNQYILPLRVILNIRPDKGGSADSKFMKILELESHLEERRGSDVWVSHHRNVIVPLQQCDAISPSKEDTELVQQICGALDVNSFEVRGAGGMAGPGTRLRGVYLEAALMTHDCVTNVHLSVDDRFVMSIRASVDIAQGQPILYNYTDPLQTTLERQKHLREGKYFLCSCKRCMDPTELGTYIGGVRCPRCHEGYVLLSPEAQIWSCEKCCHQYSSGLMALTGILARDMAEEAEHSDPLQLEFILKRLSSSLAPSHSVLIDLKQSVVAAYRELPPTRANTRRKVELCRQLLPLLRVLEPGISRLTGITMYELHMGLVTLAQQFGETGWLKEAEEVLKESVSMLVYEPSESPEGELARQAMSQLRTLKQIIAKHDLKDKKKKTKTKHK